MTMSSGSREHVGKCVLFHHNACETYGAFPTNFLHILIARSFF